MTETPTDEKTAESVPFSVRLRLALGVRVPPEYRNWAISRIKSEGWPVTFGITRVVPFWLGALSSLALISLLRPGQVGFAPWIGFGVVMPIGFALTGVVIGLVWPNYFRQRVIHHQLKKGRDDTWDLNGPT